MTAHAPKGYADNLPHGYAEEPKAAITAYAAPPTQKLETEKQRLSRLRKEMEGHYNVRHRP
jgi:hypothetical protein